MIEDLFTYKDYEIASNRQTVVFNFEIDHNGQNYQLQETLKFPKQLPDNDLIKSSLKALHLALGTSYYKIFVSNSIQHPYSIDQTEANFWNEVFENGLGEFLYVNKLSKDRLAKFSVQSGIDSHTTPTWNPERKAMLGIGGGKDSIVAGELLKQSGVDIEGFVLATGEQLGQTKRVAEVMGIDLNAVERNLDKQLLEIQELPDAYKGHIPISLIFGLIGCVLAITDNSSYVVVANESSASIPRVEWQGNMVNHQWSKSFLFETMLQKYIHDNISQKLTYFSAIRPWGSVSIAKVFANMSQYFEVFTSDNSIFRISKENRPGTRWSLESPKSLSSFILLSPWFSEEDLLRTFERNFLDESSLEKLFLELIGLEGHQPLDCVGTEEELILSLNLAFSQGKFKESNLVKVAIEKGAISDKDWEGELTRLTTPSNSHAIPKELSNLTNIIFSESKKILKNLENKDIVFVGTGKGRALDGIENFLRSNIQIKSFTSVDKQPLDNPLEFLRDYDQNNTVFIKNEGIPGNEMPVPYITQLQLFFERINEIGSKTIGITGTKGKSTTASLVAHILKIAGKDVVLAGNIGVSPLKSLNDATAATIFVLELSSYQLSDLTTSTNISACINLYNDHTTWHGSLDLYWEAKHNIVRYAKSDDYFVYNPDFAILEKWAEESKAHSIPIDTSESFDLTESELFGDHNRLNALVAKRISEIVGISNDIIVQAINSFHTLDHRMQFVASRNRQIFIDDAIGMTPESTIASLKAVNSKYGQIGCIMLGGQDRNYDFSELMKLVAELNIPNIVLFPDTIEKIKHSLPAGYSPKIFETSDMSEAVKFASENANENTVVLLSTAAPSYSVWQDFEQKGEQFQKAVRSL